MLRGFLLWYLMEQQHLISFKLCAGGKTPSCTCNKHTWAAQSFPEREDLENQCCNLKIVMPAVLN